MAEPEPTTVTAPFEITGWDGAAAGTAVYAHDEDGARLTLSFTL